MLALPVLHGQGLFSIDHWILEAVRRTSRDAAAARMALLGRLPHVMVVGGGFGGLAVAGRSAWLRAGSRCSMPTTTTCSSRCFTRLQPPASPRPTSRRLAPAARQRGHCVARVIAARLAGRPAPPRFRYRHVGSLARIERRSAVADFGPLRISGAPAWWLWGAAHVASLVGTRNRASVIVEWVWAYLTMRRSTRLITGTSATASVPGPERNASAAPGKR